MKAMVVPKAGGAFTVSERETAEPGPGTVRIRVAACGVCHSDLFVKEGYWPGMQYPRVPGHEVAGTIDAVGAGAAPWKVGDRVGIGWHGSHCGICDACRRGDFINCESLQITGIAFDGGYQQSMIAPALGLARIPEALGFAAAAPLLCAGVTTFNALRHSGAVPGDLVAVHGIGGLGHLGVQFARHFGFRVAAISRGKDKEELARRLGAHEYIDAAAANPAEALTALGGARVILATAPASKAISALVDGLGRDGKLLVVAADVEPLAVSPVQLIQKRRSVAGWPSGTPRDSQDTLEFCALTGIRPMTEELPLAEAARGYERMLSGAARFRVVLAA
jgi:D-arabinose 1-dehydrogenase-like Zn-dependent alcohol dehydrogenase